MARRKLDIPEYIQVDGRTMKIESKIFRYPYKNDYQKFCHTLHKREMYKIRQQDGWVSSRVIWDDYQHNRLIQLRQKGLNFDQISKEMDRTVSACRHQYLILQNQGRAKIQQPKVEKHIQTFLNHESFYYWAGFFAADGNVRKNNNSIRCQLNQNDLQHLYKLQKIVGGTISHRSHINNLSKKRIYSVNLQVISKQLKNRFAKLNIVPAKSLILKPPEDPMMTDEDKLKFIIGYFDGDGSVMGNVNSGIFTFCFIGTIEMMKWINEFLINYCGVQGVNIHRHNTIWGIRYNRM